MKKIGFFVSLILTASSAFASNLIVVVDGNSGATGAEIRYFKLENEFGKAQLFVLDQNSQGCRVPVSILKELGIDPIQFGLSLRNIRGNEGINLTCYMSQDQKDSRLLANRIEVVSWPRP